MTLSNVLRSLTLGALVVTGGLVLTLGPATAAQLVLVSIVCTLGIGGFFWVALAFGAGWLLLTLWEALRGHHAPVHPDVDPQAEALTQYVRRAIQAGANPDQLLRRLQRQGWTEADITQALDRVEGHPDAPNAPEAL